MAICSVRPQGNCSSRFYAIPYCICTSNMPAWNQIGVILLWLLHPFNFCSGPKVKAEKLNALVVLCGFQLFPLLRPAVVLLCLVNPRYLIHTVRCPSFSLQSLRIINSHSLLNSQLIRVYSSHLLSLLWKPVPSCRSQMSPTANRLFICSEYIVQVSTHCYGWQLMGWNCSCWASL